MWPQKMALSKKWFDSESLNPYPYRTTTHLLPHSKLSDASVLLLPPPNGLAGMDLESVKTTSSRLRSSVTTRW